MQYVFAPASEFVGNRFGSLAKAALSTTADISGLTNGTSYRFSKVTWSAPFSVTGIATPKANIPGGAADQFIVAPAADFDGGGNLINLANAIISDSMVLTGISAGSYRVGVTTPPSGAVLVRGKADPFTSVNWSMPETTTEVGDQQDFLIGSLPSDGGYPAQAIEVQTGADNGLGGITWGSIREIAAEPATVRMPVLAETKVYGRMRLKTDGGADWGDVQFATPKKTSAAATTTISFGAASLTLNGNLSTVTHADGTVAIISSGPVTLTDKAPAMTGSGATLRNGHMVNPQRLLGTSQGKQSLDGRAGNGDAPLPFPITLNPGDLFLTGVSMPDTMTDRRNGPISSGFAIYVTAAAPDPASFGPAVIGWAGRVGLAVGPTIDFLAKADRCPTTFDVPGFTYLTIDQIKSYLRLNIGNALTTKTAVYNASSAPYAGYESKMPYSWGGPASSDALSSGTANYGRYKGGHIGNLHLHLAAPLSRVSREAKAEILKGFSSFSHQTLSALQGVGEGISEDGAHNQFQAGMFATYYWCLNDADGFTAMLDRYPSNWVGQNFALTQAMLDTWFQPWGNPDAMTGIYVTSGPPSCYYRRRILEIDLAGSRVRIPTQKGGTGNAQGDDVKANYSGMWLRRESDGHQQWASLFNVTNIADGAGSVWVTLASLGSFAVGDVVHFASGFTPVLGMPAWRLNDSTARNVYIPNAEANYQDLQKYLGALMFWRAMAELRPNWKAAWDYAVAGATPNFPTVDVNYPNNWESGSLTAQFWNLYGDTLKTIPQPYLGDVPPSPFYPPVADIDLTKGGSLKLPEGNFGAGNDVLLTYKGALSQPEAGVTRPASSAPQALFAIVRMPKGKRFFNGPMGIIGNGTANASIFALRYAGETGGVPADQGKFAYYHRGSSGSVLANLKSPAWTEDAALVVAFCDGANGWLCDWYSLIDGTRYTTGTPTTSTQGAISNPDGAAIGIGMVGGSTAYSANATTSSSSPFPQWGGEIEAVGLVNRAVTPTEWSQIALGADILTILGAANVKFLREFTDLNYAANPAATLDTTGPAAPLAGGIGIPASTIVGGSKLRRTGLATYLTADQVAPGMVYGLIGDATTVMVPFSGKAVGYTGNVEVRVYDASNGDVVRDWTVVSAISGGLWGGAVELPKALNWWFCDFRPASAPSVIVQRRSEFAVGWKVLIAGQSQLKLGIDGGAATTNASPMTLSFVEGDDGDAASIRTPTLVRLGMLNKSNSLATFMNQWRKFDPTTPVMVIRDALVGTAMLDLMQDNSHRPWASFANKLTSYGNDISVVIHNWGTDESGLTNPQYKNRLDGYVYNLGTDATGRSLSTALAAGFKFVISPLTRYGNATTHDRCRTAGVEWANAKGLPVGPPISDMFIQSNQGPHESTVNPMGSDLLLARLALGCLKGLGLASFQNPSFSGATINAARTQVTISVSLPNGGSLYAPGALRNIRINGSFTGFSSAIIGNQIVCTISSGTWPTNVTVGYSTNGETRASVATSGDPTVDAIEQAIIDGFVYETFPNDVMGRGLPICGTMSAGQWICDWSVTVP